MNTFRHTETIAALQAFRKRHADAQRLHVQYASQPTTVDFAHYRSILKNKAIVDEAEKLSKEFKPVTYDTNAHLKAIEAFETKAVGGPFGVARAFRCDVRKYNRLQKLRRRRRRSTSS